MPAAPAAAMAMNAGRCVLSPVFAEVAVVTVFPPVTLVTFAGDAAPDLFDAGVTVPELCPASLYAIR